MGSFIFKWEHPASEVYVTGTFDDWKKSERLEKNGDIFEKNVTLSSAAEKIYYKFVVDGNWVTDHTAPQENDESGNLNNVLTTDRIIKHDTENFGILSGVTPSSTTAALAKDVPKDHTGYKAASSDLPGSFPETPAATEKGDDFSVSPLPAADGAVNPIRLAPGEKVPDPSSFTDRTITSGVRHDDPDLLEALKKSEEAKGGSHENGDATFGVAPLPAFPGAVNPIKIAPGEKLPDANTLTGNTVQSTVRTDPESYERGSGIGNAPIIPPVVTPQNEREKSGTGILDIPPISKYLIPESSLPMGTSGSGTFNADPTIQSSGPESTTTNLAAAVPLESSKVPEIVKDSQAKAGFDPEASGVPEEVREKSAVEKELEGKIPEAPATSEGIAGQGTTKSEKGVTAGEAGTAVVGAATAIGGVATLAASSLATGVANKIPESAKSRLPESIQSSASPVNTQFDSDINTAKDTPEVVKESIAESGQAPEAAANEEAVLEKKAVEKELLSEVKKETSTGEPAPKITPNVSSGIAKAPTVEDGIDSRDVSPGTIPGSRTQTHSEGPRATTGVAAVTTPKKSTPATTESTEASAKGTSSSKASETPASASASQKKKNRASAFFSKIKSKLSDK